MTWITKIGMMVWTSSARYAGTDNRVVVNLKRDSSTKEILNLDYRNIDDLEPGSRRFYGYSLPRLHLDRTPPLPEGIGRIPAPYPVVGVEFSDGLRGHLTCQLEIKGNDLWIKDRIDIYVKHSSLRATSFDTLEWIEDTHWTLLGTWGQDARISTDSREGVSRWSMVY